MNSLPSWKISFSRAGTSQVETITIEGGSLITAYKDAIAQFWKAGHAIRVISMEMTSRPAEYMLDDEPIVELGEPT